MTTTLEKLYEIYPTTASIIPYKEWVIVASNGYKGTEVEIYETADSLEEFELFECRLNRIYKESIIVTDLGHAVKWVFDMFGE
ncbi:Nmad4 family putative nucleotide modification protein [Streptococcus suis]